MNGLRVAALVASVWIAACAGDAVNDVDASVGVDMASRDASSNDAAAPEDGGVHDATVLEDATVGDDAAILVDGGASFPITRACPAFAGGSANGECVFPQVSADGRFVAFSSDATDLLADPLVNPVGSRPLHRFFVRDTMLGVTELVSFNSSEGPAGTPYSPVPPSMSADGRYVLFSLPANEWDSVTYSSPNPTLMLLRDRMLSTTTVVSERVDGNVYDGTNIVLSGDGHSVVFQTPYAVTEPGTGFADEQIYLRDLTADGDAIEVVSIGPDGMPAVAGSTIFGDVDISNDGSKVLFTTNATNFLTGATSAGVPAWMKHCFVRDRLAGTTTRVDVASVGSTGDWADGECSWAAISGDGRFVVFSTNATNILAGDTNGFDDLYVRDLMLGTTERVTLSDADAEIVDSAPTSTATIIREIDISDDGDWIIFLSFSHSLVAGDTALEAGRQGFLRRRSTGHTGRFTMHPDGTEFGDSQAAFVPRISGDGSLVVFTGSHAGIFPDSSGDYELFAVETSTL